MEFDEFILLHENFRKVKSLKRHHGVFFIIIIVMPMSIKSIIILKDKIKNKTCKNKQTKNPPTKQ